MILSPEVLTLQLLNILFLIFGGVALWLSVNIYLKWDINSTNPLQYKLEKQSFLASTIIKYLFAIKLPLFLFFIFTLDKISTLLTGAMCGAGVVDATSYGTPLITLKILNIYLFGLWLSLHFVDIKQITLPKTKLKFGLFIVLFSLLLLEIVVEYLMFNSIEIDKMVSCCGTLFSTSATSTMSNIFAIDSSILLSIFYGNFILLVLFYKIKPKYLFGLFNLLFIIISLLTLITFFSTYIYELPTHHCPFCILQKDYYYVGYLLYTTLFIGTFYGIKSEFIESNQKDYKISLIFNFFYIVIVSLYVVIYYLKNDVWL
ncbi:MAG TPA: hypothetical protein EYG69_03975 [Campylobacterales bacterium]|nr:hypothetical protein [Campylobacterales bacterium]